MGAYLRIVALAFAFTVFSSPFFVYSTSSVVEKKTDLKEYKEIHTEQLKKLIDSKKPVLILDARKKLSGGLLPNAKQLAYDADAKTIEKTIGSVSKDMMIVVYCANKDCPVSKYLAESLVSLGYTNVYKYPEGIAEWIQIYPVDKIK